MGTGNKWINNHRGLSKIHACILLREFRWMWSTLVHAFKRIEIPNNMWGGSACCSSCALGHGTGGRMKTIMQVVIVV
jgi:hypothetical protein